MTSTAETKKRIVVWREISQSSLSQELGNHQIPTLCKRMAFDRGPGYMNGRQDAIRTSMGLVNAETVHVDLRLPIARLYRNTVSDNFLKIFNVVPFN